MNRRAGRPPLSVLETSAEREAFAAATYFARQHDLAHPPESAYLTQLPAARRHLLRVLAASLVAEASGWLPEPFSVGGDDRTIPGEADVESWLPDALAALSTTPADGTLTVLAFSRSQAAVVTPVVAGPAYRPQPVGGVFVCTPDETRRLTSPAHLFDALIGWGAVEEGAAARRCARTLENAVANLALAYVARERFPRIPPDESLLSGVPKRLGGADAAATFERLSAIEESSQAILAKYRSLSPAAALGYTAEFTDTVDVRFVAVETASVRSRRVAGGRSLSTRLSQLFDGLAGAVDDALPPGRNSDQFSLFPIHPWQFYHVLFDRFERELGEGVIVPLDYHAPATPLANLRTMVPFLDGPPGTYAPHLKLTLGVRKSTTVRHLRPASVWNGPQLSAVLCGIEPDLDRLGILAEEAAACYHPWDEAVVDGHRYDAACTLSALVRTNPHAHPLADGRHPIMTGALFADVPGRDGPLAIELLSAFADARDESVAAAAEPFFEAYLDVVLPDVLRLLTAFGVGLEHHPQNCLVVFDDDARPVATLARDFGGIRILEDRLRTHGLCVDFYPNSDPDATDRTDLYSKVHSSFIMRNVGELIGLFAAHTALTSEECWSRVATRSRAVFDDLRRTDAAPQSWVDADEEALFADRIRYKADTRMMLEDMRHESVFTTVSNPLAEVE